jgi:hypothetical protein
LENQLMTDEFLVRAQAEIERADAKQAADDF